MPAYAKRLDKRGCDWPECSLTASHAVYNTYNAHMGDFCEKHAHIKLATMNMAQAVKDATAK